MTDLTELQKWIDKENAEIVRRATAEKWSFYTTLMEAKYWHMDYGYTTPREVQDHLDMETYSEAFREKNGYRPIDATPDNARKWLEDQRRIMVEEDAQGKVFS